MAGLAAFTVPGMGAAVWKMIEQDLQAAGVTHPTEKFGPRLVEQGRASYLRPTIVHAPSPESPVAQKEYMFPFASVIECPQAEMLKRIGPTLVGTIITNDESFRHAATNATNIDRLNLGPVPTTKLNWLQPHEGNLIDFLFRNRALQVG
jgi:acyl-CoA reductase-like NAD-dependent aldehyde dehydrogenase